MFSKSIQADTDSAGIVFSRPIISSLLLGTLVHLVFNIYQISFYLQAIESSSFLTRILAIAIPYVLFYWLLPRKVKQVVSNKADDTNAFFELNPDLMFRLNTQGKLISLNPATESLFLSLDTSDSREELLLPNNITEIIESAIANHTDKLGLEHRIGDNVYDYSIVITPGQSDVLITGRNITKRRIMENRLLDSQNILKDMNDLVDRTFSNYDHDSFEVKPFTEELISLVLNPRMDNPASSPCAVLFLSEDESKFTGRQFYLHEEHLKSLYLDVAFDKNAIPGMIQASNDITQCHCESDSFNQVLNLLGKSKLLDSALSAKSLALIHSGKTLAIAFYEREKLSVFDTMLLKALVVYGNALHHIALEHQENELTFSWAIDTLTRASQISGVDNGAHNIRINEYSKALATHMQLPEDYIHQLSYSAQLHDVGQICIPNTLLAKKDLFEEEERKIMQKHCVIGAGLLENFPRLTMATTIANCHHERFDGSGYPRGLIGEEIPLAARIVAVADVYDALRQNRSYRAAVSHNEAIHMITEGGENIGPEQFDPEILDALITIQDRFDQIFSRHQ